MISRPDSDDRLRPPSDLTVDWQQSETDSGRVAVSLHWKNNDARTASALVEVTGRYGSGNAFDIPVSTDGRLLPNGGTCGHWYRRAPRADDGERGIYIDGLWARSKYCFSVNVSDPAGGTRAPYPSVGTSPSCESAPWNKKWGDADLP